MKKISNQSFFILFISLIISFQGGAYTTTETEMSTGELLSITEFKGDGETLILWIPSERGYRKGSIPVTTSLSDSGIDVRVVDLHESYMIQQGNKSFDDFENVDLLELVEQYQAQGFKEIYLMSAGRGSVVALQLARDWQIKYPKQSLLKGFIFTHPHLILGRPDIGTDAQYVDIARKSNLPVYIFQPEYSTKFARRLEIAKILKMGGSSVFIHILKEVHGGFYMRGDDRVDEVDIKAKGEFPYMIESAINLLRVIPKPLYAANADKIKINQEIGAQAPSFRSANLYPYKGNPVPPVTQLKTYSGEDFDLSSIKNEVVLINFWATWCGPCIEEIPSLNRLLSRMDGKPFKILAVNIGEPKKEIEFFLKQLEKTGVTLDFPVLLDEQGQSVRDWKVYAYPSNYLINKSGQISHAYRGALKWDAPHIVETIESLF